MNNSFMSSREMNQNNNQNQNRSCLDNYNDFKILDTLKQQRCQSQFSVFNNKKMSQNSNLHRTNNNGGQLSKSIQSKQDYGNGMQINIKQNIFQLPLVNQSADLYKIKNSNSQNYQSQNVIQQSSANFKIDELNFTLKEKMQKNEAHFSTPNTANKKDEKDAKYFNIQVSNLIEIDQQIEINQQNKGHFENTNKQEKNIENEAESIQFENNNLKRNCGINQIEQDKIIQMNQFDNQQIENQTEKQQSNKMIEQFYQSLDNNTEKQVDPDIFQTDKLQKQNIMIVSEYVDEQNQSRNKFVKQAFSADLNTQKNLELKHHSTIVQQKNQIKNQKPIMDLSQRYQSSQDMTNDVKQNQCNQDQQEQMAEQNSDLVSITVERNQNAKNSFFRNSIESSSGEFQNQHSKNIPSYDNNLNNDINKDQNNNIFDEDFKHQKQENIQSNQNILIQQKQIHLNHNSFSSQNKQQIQGNLYKSKSMNSYKKDFMTAQGCQSFEHKNSHNGMIILQNRQKQDAENLEDKKKESNLINLTPNHNHPFTHNKYISNASQISCYEARKSSISPTRSAMGLASINQNKEKVDQALQDRCTKSLEELHKVKQEYRAKEQDYEKKIAIMKQQIELLQIQVKETEQREEQQRQMYERIFQALDPQQQAAECYGNIRNSGSASRQKRTDDIFNTTQMSFGKEIEQIQKQFHEEMQSRIIELELILKQKEQEFEEQKQRKEQQIKNLINDLIGRDKDNQEKSMLIKNLQRQIEDNENQLSIQKETIKSISYEMEELKQNNNFELQNMEKDYQEKYSQLKFIYQTQQKQNNNNLKGQQNNYEDYDEMQIDAYLERIRNLEQSLLNSKSELSDHQIILQQKNFEVQQYQDQLQILEQKLIEKKDKIRQLFIDQDQKSKEYETLRTQVIDLEGQAMLNEKFMRLNSFNSQINQKSTQSNEQKKMYANIGNSFQEFKNQQQYDDQNENYQQLKQNYFQNGDLQYEDNLIQDGNSDISQNIQQDYFEQESNVQHENLQKKSGNFGQSFQNIGKQKMIEKVQNEINQEEEQYNSSVRIQFEEMQLFDRLKTMIDSTVKMECAGCHKLIPTIQFYDHLLDPQTKQNLNNQSRHFTCEDEPNYLHLFQQQLSNNKSILNGEIVSDFINQNHDDNKQIHNKQFQNRQSIQKDDTFLLSGSIENKINNSSLYMRSKSQNAASASRFNNYPHIFQTTSEDIINNEKKNRQTARLYDQTSASTLGLGIKNKQNSQSNQQAEIEYKGKYLNSLKVIKKLQSQISLQISQITELQLNIEQLNEINIANNRDAIDEAQEKLIQQLKDEKQKVLLTLDRVKLQLEQKKTQLALLDEKRAENELKLKKEKKTLLQQLLKLRDQYQQLLLVHQNQELQRIDQMNQIGRMAMALSTNGSLMNQIQQANASQKNSSQGFMRDTQGQQENQYAEQDSLLMANIFPQSILDSGLDKLVARIQKNKVDSMNHLDTNSNAQINNINYYGQQEHNLNDMKNTEYDSEDISMIEDQYAEDINDDKENYDDTEQNIYINPQPQQKQQLRSNDVYQHFNNYSQTSYFTSQNQDNINDTQQISNKFSQENTINSQIYNKNFPKNINLNKTNYIAGYNEPQSNMKNETVPFIQQDINCNNFQAQNNINKVDQKKFKIKILDSRTTATRINSQFQSGSNISSNSVIIGARGANANGQTDRQGKINQVNENLRVNQIKNENFYINKQRA